MTRVTGPCTNECYYGATEIKFEDMTWTGARLCCPTHIDDIDGNIVSVGSLATVSVYSQKGEMGFELQYREGKSLNCHLYYNCSSRKHGRWQWR